MLTECFICCCCCWLAASFGVVTAVAAAVVAAAAVAAVVDGFLLAVVLSSFSLELRPFWSSRSFVILLFNSDFLFCAYSDFLCDFCEFVSFLETSAHYGAHEVAYFMF